MKGTAVFKDPSQGIEPGVSLCKLGFPFHDVPASWNAEAGEFTLAEGALPLPRFPLEGIFTRGAKIQTDGPPPEIPLLWLETSSPGLRGQSGGPTYDTRGTVWAIQVQTRHMELGFQAEVRGQKGHREHQFLNVGLGVHPATIKAFLDKFSIAHQMSDY